MTLTELMVTVAIAAVLMAIAVPAAKRLTESLQTSAGAHGLINAALSNARAIAVRQGTYAGVRFQQAVDGKTYMVFIVHDPRPSPDGTGLANGFRAVDGRKAIALPQETGVMAVDQTLDAYLATPAGWNDATTFSVVFHDTGKLVLHDVRVQNKDGKTDDSSKDSVFNTIVNVNNKRAMFYQDDDPAAGRKQELSFSSLRIYDKKELEAVNAANRWTAYLSKLNTLRISPYTGELIGE